VKLGLASGLPILSRHRAYGGSLSGIAVGGRKVGEVMAQLGVQLDAQATATARGFQLLRSLTDLMDLSGLPAAAPVQSYLRKQPKPGETVSFAALADLAALTPLQLSVLERSNIASEEASFVREAYALLRFYQGLSPAQQQALFSKEGLDVSELTHEQWHALLDQRDKRGDFNILNSVQEIKGLRFRFLERRDRKEGSFRAEALRAGQLVAEADLDLPVVEAEVRPIAAR